MTTSKASPTRKGISRRGLLRAGAAGAVGIGLGPAILSPSARGGDTQLGVDEFRFLLDHATQGFDWLGYQQAKAMGYDNWIEWQLDHTSIDDSAIEDLIATELPATFMDMAQLFTAYVLSGQQYRAMLDVQSATTLRSLYSPRQLHERMCEFWADHFSIDQNSVDVFYNTFHRDVIRPHALGKFPEMLEASAQSGAMLRYLTNDSNIVGNPQENYAREVMELHTLGVDGPFNETDVEELAKVFTGWTIYTSQFYAGNYAFFPSLHDYSQKTVMGRTINGSGEFEGIHMLRILGRHRSTSEYLALKMTRWLLRYDPPARLVARVARTYRQTDGDIKAMVRVILERDNVVDAQLSGARKLKRPYQFLTNLCRATYTEMEGDEAYSLKIGDLLSSVLAIMGQQLFANPTPDGYPDEAEAWGSSVLPRWTVASWMFDRALHRVTPNLGKLSELVGVFDRDRLASQISMLLTGGSMLPGDVAQVQQYVDQRPFHDQTVREAFALAASSPSFQSY